MAEPSSRQLQTVLTLRTIIENEEFSMTTIHVCANHETLVSGLLQDSSCYTAEIDSAINEVCALIDDAGLDCESKCQRFFADWNGGKFDRPGQVIGSTKFGYGAATVCTLAQDPSPEVCALIDRAADLLNERLAEISDQEDRDTAEANAAD